LFSCLSLLTKWRIATGHNARAGHAQDKQKKTGLHKQSASGEGRSAKYAGIIEITWPQTRTVHIQ